MNIRLTLSLPLLLAFSGAVLAEEDAALPAVVVSASRLPETPGIASSHIQVIAQDTIRRSAARDVAALLREVAVIQLTDTVGDGSSGAVGMRGFGENGSQNSLLLLNGRRLNNDSDIAPPELRNLSIDDIDHIEIINGSAGALFGSGAVGGVINIVTKPIARELRGGASAGSYDYGSYRARAGERAGALGLQLLAEKTTADNYRDRNELNRGFLQGRVTADFDNAGLFLEASRHNLEQNLAGSLLPAQLREDRRQAQYPGDFTEGENHRYSAGGHFEFLPDWQLTLDGSLRRDNAHGVLQNTPIFQSRDQHSVNPRLNGKLGWEEFTVKLVGGYDYDSANYHFFGFGPMDSRQRVRSRYLQLGLGAGDAWELVAAGRHAELKGRIQDGFTFTTGQAVRDDVDIGSLALYWRPVEGFNGWLRADENFRFGATDEHTAQPFGVTVPLDTQTGISYEAGAEVRGQAWQGSLQFYRLQLDNEISFDPLLFANINLDETQRDGVSAQFGFRLGEQFQASLQLAHVDAEFTGGPNEGRRIPFVARDKETLGLTWVSPWDVDLTLEQQRTGGRYPSGDYDNSQSKLKPVYLSNLAATYRWKGLEVAARVNNLLNRKHNAYSTETLVSFEPFILDTAHVPAPERNLLVSVDYRFP